MYIAGFNKFVSFLTFRSLLYFFRNFELGNEIAKNLILVLGSYLLNRFYGLHFEALELKDNEGCIDLLIG